MNGHYVVRTHQVEGVLGLWWHDDDFGADSMVCSFGEARVPLLVAALLGHLDSDVPDFVRRQTLRELAALTPERRARLLSVERHPSRVAQPRDGSAS